MRGGRGAFSEFAERLVENGFTVTPTNGKVPVVRRWQNPKPTDPKWLGQVLSANRYSANNIGIVCGRVVGIDIDADDSAKVEQIKVLATEHLGPTSFQRVGRAPRTLLLYRTAAGEVIDSTKVACNRCTAHRLPQCLDGVLPPRDAWRAVIRGPARKSEPSEQALANVCDLARKPQSSPRQRPAKGDGRARPRSFGRSSDRRQRRDLGGRVPTEIKGSTPCTCPCTKPHDASPGHAAGARAGRLQ